MENQGHIVLVTHVHVLKAQEKQGIHEYFYVIIKT